MDMPLPSPRARFFVTAAILAMLAGANATAAAAIPEEQARVAEGKKLVASSACEKCHAGKVGGDGSAMYLRKDRKVSSRARLVVQVARCSSELNLGLFPDDEVAIAAYLNQSYYKFKD